MQKSIKKMMHLGIDFWIDVCGFWVAKWSHVCTNVDQKLMPFAKSEFLKNHVLVVSLQLGLDFSGSRVGSLEQKSIKNRSPKMTAIWEAILASWHRFLIGFDRLCGPSWEGKCYENRSQKISRQGRKQKCKMMAKMAYFQR